MKAIGSSARAVLALAAVIALAAVLAARPDAGPSEGLGTAPAQPGAARLPRLVFASRHPIEGAAAGTVPGLGPHQRAAAPGGRLMIREPDGRVRPLLRAGLLYDVSDPDVSWDARRIVFAATPARDSAWRIYVVGTDGRNLRALTGADSANGTARFDDLDPCWLPDGRVCFASTRYPQLAQLGGVATTNLFIVGPDGGRPVRMTSERNGAEQPTVHPLSGRIVYARWWFNRYLATETDPSGLTTARARAVPGDSVNLWQAVSATPDGDQVKLAGGNPRVRAEMMAYQPLVLGEGTLVGVWSSDPGLSPAPGVTGLQIFRGGFGPALRPSAIPAGASACAPAALPERRILFSLDRLGNGDYGLYTIRRDGSGLRKVLDLPGTLELDGAVVARRPRPPVLPSLLMEHPRKRPPRRMEEVRDINLTFRFDCLNVFTNAPVDVPITDAPPIDRDVRIRFYAALSRPGQPGADTAVLVREARVRRTGGVHEHELPADVPLFEQLVDAHGHVLRSTLGPAHVSGLNSGRFGAGTHCVGCHAGHSAIAVPRSYTAGKRFNVSPSALVTASSEANGSGARAAVDRRTRGPASDVAWIARSHDSEWIRLAWKWPIEVDTLVVYAVRAGPTTDLRVPECELILLYRGAEVRRALMRDVLASGTRVGIGGVRVDAIEVRPRRSEGRVEGRPAVGLAEIETIARLTED